MDENFPKTELEHAWAMVDKARERFKGKANFSCWMLSEETGWEFVPSDQFPPCEV